MGNPTRSTGELTTQPRSRRLAAQLAVFAALVAFLPIPLVIPFWAIAIVPVSYLVISAGRVGSVGLVYGLVAAVFLYVIAKFLCNLIFRAQEPGMRKALVVAVVAILFVLSFLPIYKPGLDPPKPVVNIVGLFQRGISVGQ
jgi:hypothetical protein